jgi:NTP pyrophosphatase (non-canonical NTP hydrolase)
VLSGSFHREPARLRETHHELSVRFRVLSPSDTAWVDPGAAFVRLPSEVREEVSSIEARHLRAIEEADFVWLFCPAGYVGTSAAMEVGFAHAVGVPVLSDELPSDDPVRSMVTLVQGFDDVPVKLQPDPGRALTALQRYYGRIAERRGWADESPRDILLLLTEEVGELARAVRKEAGLSRDGEYPRSAVGDELADAQLYLVHLANSLGVDLSAAVTAKELDNSRRHAKSDGQAA